MKSDGTIKELKIAVILNINVESRKSKKYRVKCYTACVGRDE